MTKAFDSVDYDILLMKLENYGFRDKIHNILKTYLCNRTIKIKCDNCFSTPLTLGKGLPQGSPLSSHFFIIYMNDLFNLSIHGRIFAHADDICYTSTSTSVVMLNVIALSDVDQIQAWYSANYLILNPTKTEVVIVSHRQKRLVLPIRFSVFKDNQCVQVSPQITILGIIIHEHLLWNAQINKVTNRIAKYIGFIYKYRYILSPDTLKVLYFSFVQSILLYALPIWGAAPAYVLNSILVLQKRFLRIINHLSW